MLAGGKEVNYLMINGDVFASNQNFGQNYNFSNSNPRAKYYDVKFDSDNKPIMSMAKMTARTANTNLDYTIELDVPNSAMVYKIITFQNEKFALTECRLIVKGSNNIAPHMPLWIKMSDFGGGTPIVENGGVNSPSYLLVIYNMEVMPSC